MLCWVALMVLDRESIASAANAIEITWPDRRLAMAAGNVEHIIRLAQAGDASTQGTHQFLALLDRRLGALEAYLTPASPPIELTGAATPHDPPGARTPAATSPPPPEGQP